MIIVCIYMLGLLVVLSRSHFFPPYYHPSSGKAFQVYLYFFNLIVCSMLSAAFSEVLTWALHLNLPDLSSSLLDQKWRTKYS